MKAILLSGILILCNYLGFGQVAAFPDSTFNGTGRKIFSMGGTLDFGDNVVLQPDGKIIMTGATFIGGYAKLGVCRMMPDGSFDPSFGTAGKVTVDLGLLGYQGGFEPEMVLQSDGSILICGFAQIANPGDDDMFVCKLSSSGSLDPSFGTGGRVSVDMIGGGAPDAAYAITTDNAGNVYACGATRTGGTPFTNDMAIIKLTPAGVLDPSFSGDGKLLLDVSGSWDFAYGISVRTDGKIIVGGYAGLPADFVALRLNPDGSYDNSFSGDGKVTVDIFGQNVADEVWGMSVDPDGKILLAGDGIDVSAGSIAKGAIVRLTADGNIDPTFNGDGIATFPVGTTSTMLRNITRMTDGRYAISGDAAVNVDKDYCTIRLLANGTQDSSFNFTGYFTMDVSGLGKDDLGYGLAVQPDGKIIVSGNTSYSAAVNEKYSLVRIVSPNVLAGFTASSNLICNGGSVQFTNTSMGDNLSYEWTFEGGSPGISVAVNPLVTYSAPGIYDVKLITYNSNFSDTLNIPNMIEVVSQPTAPAVPSGSASTCSLQSAVYSITPVTYATTYTWQLDPPAAGSLQPNGTIATFTAAVSWTGAYTIKVNAANQCGISAWSPAVNCTLNHMPSTFMIQGEGVYCQGTTGTSITLNGSETGVNYDLYLENSPTGNVQAGTGSSLTWNNIVIQGFYTVNGYTSSCNQQMAGQIYVEMKVPPAQLAVPTGSSSSCNNISQTYSVAGVAAGDNLEWTLLPAGAGAMTPQGSQVLINWDPSFHGNASLSVHALNECGQGPESQLLLIQVYQSPDPVVSGVSTVCYLDELPYETATHSGSSYVWDVTGGEITSGAGTSQVHIQWKAIGAGTISVTETNADACAATSQVFNIEILLCEGVNTGFAKDVLRFFPNPAEKSVNLLFDKPCEKKRSLVICDLQGRAIKDFLIPAGSKMLENVDISYLSPGTYLFKLIRSNDSDRIARFIKK
ncbi:MAG: PKD domain-containing protein [Bacteroidetes bacterium]|nr:PKD domain-containing protein [Bacteroidota bacterium]